MDPGAAVVARSPVDVLRLVVAGTSLLALVLVEALFGGSVVGFSSDLLRGFDAFGEGFVTAIVAVVRVLTVGLLVAGFAYAVLRGRWRVLLTGGLGGAAGLALFLLVDASFDSQRAVAVELSDWLGPVTDATFPTGRGMAAAVGIVAAVGPWLPRRLRRVGWALVIALTTVRFLAVPVSGRSFAALLSGWTGGTLALVVLGSPTMRPTREAVMRGLQAVGVQLAALEPAKVDARGSTPYFGTTTPGTPLFVKALGRDERDADLLFRLYRSVVPRNLGDERPFSSLRRAVEHEAFCSLAVTAMEVRTPRFVALGHAEPNAFVLAYEAVAGTSLDGLPAEEVTDELLDQIWGQLEILRAHRVAHRDLRLANVFVDHTGTVWLIDFGFSELSAADVLLATDVAEAICSLATKVGAERAVAGAVRSLGVDVATAVPRLRLGYLSGATRTALKQQPGLLTEIRALVAPSAEGAAGPRVALG